MHKETKAEKKAHAAEEAEERTMHEEDVARREAHLAEAPPPPSRFRVSLEGVKVRTLDAEGRPQIVEELEVEAASPEEAWEKFKVASGVVSSDYKPRIVPVVPAEPPLHAEMSPPESPIAPPLMPVESPPAP